MPAHTFSKPMAAIIKKLKQDHETGRTRDAKAGEESIYDVLRHKRNEAVDMRDLSKQTRSWGRVSFLPDEWITEAPSSFYCSEDDVAEDVMLFPDK